MLDFPALIDKVPSLWPIAMCPDFGLKATALDYCEGGNGDKVEAPPLGAFLTFYEIVPLEMHYFFEMLQTLTKLSSPEVIT